MGEIIECESEEECHAWIDRAYPPDETYVLSHGEYARPACEVLDMGSVQYQRGHSAEILSDDDRYMYDGADDDGVAVDAYADGMRDTDTVSYWSGSYTRDGRDYLVIYAIDQREIIDAGDDLGSVAWEMYTPAVYIRKED
jgi:hypothetical protein